MRVEMKHVVDACAAGISFACLVDLLPPMAAFLSIIWLCIEIFDYFARKRWKK